MATDITRGELQQKLEHPNRHAHVPGALNTPPDQVRTLASELVPRKDKDMEVIVYCAGPTCHASEQVALGHPNF